MNTSLITAANTMSQLQKQMDVITNNITNIDKTGYKGKQATFTDLLYQQVNVQPDAQQETGRLTPNGIRQGAGARIGQIQTNTSEGELLPTGRDLDTAFQKEDQYYKVLAPDNTVQYTRDGAFKMSPVAPNETMLVTDSGNPVLDENNKPIIITGSPTKYEFSQDGQLNVTKADGSRQSFSLGVIQLNNPQFFEQKSGSLLGPPANVPVPAGVFTNLTGAARGQISIGQGMLEQSNVDLTKEMTDMMSMQRLYQFQSRAVTISDQMMGLINGIR